ncbi:Extracellular esterase EstB [Streptomyces sp. RB5]|uniref:Extracellular esterase EstB n=1 Tax=Streptomyces smaragdinus TaxID=2585196 RepID=A0A7K0CUF5_9ACTN|nr:alpha/beta fold hydrolase [Streptomyces smaragdinus]MQY16334.1 Extracellular esterase EstB [Streptomyces smaragdinus]
MGAPPHRLGPLSALVRAQVLEVLVLTGHLLLYPTGIRPEPTPADTGHRLPTHGRTAPPVLLLHGFIDNRSVFALLRRSLRHHGWRHVRALNYSPLTHDIRRAADQLAHHVTETCRLTGHDRVDIVGHSLGGLIARYYVQRLGGHRRVRTVVTLGTPHAGTRTASLLAAHPIVRQMRPGSDLIRELALPAPDCTTRFTAFWSELDELMIPAGTARIDHPDLRVRNVPVRGVGHLALPVHPAVVDAVRRALADTESGQESTGSRESDGVSVA